MKEESKMCAATLAVKFDSLEVLKDRSKKAQSALLEAANKAKENEDKQAQPNQN